VEPELQQWQPEQQQTGSGFLTIWGYEGILPTLLEKFNNGPFGNGNLK